MLFKTKYRIESTRLRYYDYSSPGAYFVTICTKDRQCWFGDIVNGKIQLSPIGQIVAEEWKKTEMIRPDVTLDEWIVMPNHLHGIVVIQESSETTRRVVSTGKTLKPKSLGSIIGQFKSVSAKRIHAAGYPEFAWQQRYYDHIIRNEKSFNKIRQYISNNVIQWELDRNHPSGLIDWV